MNALICQPTCQRTYTEVLAARADATIAVEKYFGSCGNTWYTYLPSDYNNPSMFLVSLCLKDIDKADAVVFCTGWEEDRVCRIEHYAATQYNKKIYYFIGKELVAQ